jgi:transcription elongation factor GreB
MSRYRPPAAAKTPYITAPGYRRLQEESKALWQRRHLVTKALAAAAAEGDRSENAEYIYRKKELREIDRRIRYLQKRLPELHIVNAHPNDQQSVFFGAWITLQSDDGEQVTYRIVGPDETEPKQGFISIDSPMAKALLKKRVDDDVFVQTPQGEATFSILNVRYSEEG